VSLLLHPSLPPMNRPQPPISSLHFLAPENDEEKRIRLELGFTTTHDDAETSLRDREVDQPVEPPVPHLNQRTALPATQSFPVIVDPSPILPVTRIQTNEDQSRERLNAGTDRPANTHEPSPPMIPTAIPASGISSQPVNTGTRAAEPFMSAPTASSLDKGKGREIEPEIRRREDSDSPIPELDTGSSGFEDFDDDEDDEEDMEEG